MQVDWRPVIWGLTLQFVFALLILRWTVGQQVFETVANLFNRFADYTLDGSTFVYGLFWYRFSKPIN